MPADQLRNFLNAGYVPQPHQLPFHAAARECDADDGPDEVAQGGARGPGKSHSTLAQIGLDDCQRFGGTKWLFLRNIKAAASEAFEDLVPKVFGRTRHQYVPTRNRITFPNGSKITLGGFKDENDIDNYLGIEYDGIAIEEATLLSKSKKDKLQGSLRSAKPGWKPRLYLTYNPGGIGHAWVKESYYLPYILGTEKSTRFIPGRAAQNVFVNEGYHRYLDSLTGWLRDAWRDGNMEIAAGLYFTNWRSHLHIISESALPDPVPLHWRLWLAMDYGFTHWNPIYLFAQDGDGRVLILDECAHRGWLPARHCEAIDALLRRWKIDRARIETFVAGGDVFNARGVTARGGGAKTVADEYAENGWPLARAQMDRIGGATRMLTYLGDSEARDETSGAPSPIAPRLLVSARCVRLINCLPNLLHDPHRPEDVLKVDTDTDGNGGDDFYDAARYGLMAATGDGSGAGSYDYAEVH